MEKKNIEKEVILHKLRGEVPQEELEITLQKLRKHIEITKRDGVLILNRPIVSRGGAVGRIIIYLKTIIRKSIWWYIGPVVDQQNKYNEDVADILNGLLSIILELEKQNRNDITEQGEGL